MARYQFTFPVVLVLTIVFLCDEANAFDTSAFQIFETLTDHVTTVIKEEYIQCHNYTEFCNTYLKIPKLKSSWFTNPPNIDAIRGVCQTMLKRLVCEVTPEDSHDDVCVAEGCPDIDEAKL